MSSRKNDKPHVFKKKRVYGPASAKQQAWVGGYGDTERIAKLRRDAVAKERALLEARECEADVIHGIL